jgi:hypothetical protein
VNDYLAQRDAELNRPLFEFLGLSIGTIYSMQDPAEKADLSPILPTVPTTNLVLTIYVTTWCFL